MLASARVLVKPYRLEIGLAAIAAIIVGIGALIVTYRLVSIPMPPGCFEAWVQGPGAVFAPDCEHATSLWESIDANEVGPVFSAMIFLPFVVGLIGGVPIVARELEMGTAQTAWFLWPSRLRWLAAKLVPVLVLLGLTIAFTAISATFLGRTQPGVDVTHLSAQGPIVVGRALAAFGVGLVLGSGFGRSLPAFLIGVLLCGLLGWVAESARYDWLFDRRVLIGSGDAPIHSGYGFGFAWRTPDGGIVPWDDRIYELVPPEAQEYTEDPDSGPEAWLRANGYEFLMLGVTEEIVGGWVPLDVAGMSLIGLAGIGGTAVVVNRRRPT